MLSLLAIQILSVVAFKSNLKHKERDCESCTDTIISDTEFAKALDKAKQLNFITRYNGLNFLTFKKVSLSTEQPIFKSVLPFFKFQLRLCNLLCSLPFEWDSTTGRMILLRSNFKGSICTAQMVLHVCYCLGMLGYFVSPQSMKINPTSTKMIGFVFLVCFLATMFMKLVFWKKRKEVVLMVNSFIQFEDNYLPKCNPKSNKQATNIVSKAMLTLGVATSVGLPGLMLTMLAVNTCQPPHLGYILFKNDLHKCLVPHVPIRLALLTFDAWMWANSIVPACFFAFPIFYLGLQCLNFYLVLLIRATKTGFPKVFLSHAEKDRMCFTVYRHLKLLANLYNECLKSVFIPTQISAACLVIIIGLYTCIKLHRVIPMPGFVFFPLLSLDGFSMIFISQIGANTFILSKKFLRIIRKNRKYTKATWLWKVADSLDFIKIRYGAVNFLDTITPSVIVNFCLTHTVTLILLT